MSKLKRTNSDPFENARLSLSLLMVNLGECERSKVCRLYVGPPAINIK